MRWLWWFLVVPQGFLLVGYLRDLGLPTLDMAVLSALFLAWFAQVSTLPFLLLGVAIGRALVDQASLPVHLLVIGVPVAMFLPLRSLFVAQRWLWQAIAAALLAILIPQLSRLCGHLFDQPSAGAALDGWRVVWAALLLPPVLLAVRVLPPFRAFTEPGELLPGGNA